jgi:hypothetical protein
LLYVGDNFSKTNIAGVLWRAVASSTATKAENPMARVRCITEMGMGVDVHGKDAT